MYWSVTWYYVFSVTDMEIMCNDTSSQKYLSLVELGRALEILNNNCRGTLQYQS